MESIILYLIPVFGLIGLIVMGFKSSWVSRQPDGDPNMVELSNFTLHLL
jgi:K(+)-stimulated pyrophosphate-energized sodium pump